MRTTTFYEPDDSPALQTEPPPVGGYGRLEVEGPAAVGLPRAEVRNDWTQRLLRAGYRFSYRRVDLAS